VITREPEIRFVGANVARLRRKAGQTQAQLAEATGISIIALSKIESGLVSDVYLSTLIRLARALQVSAATLLRPAKLVKRGRGRPKKGS
jgi:transcriptional regulator with XRE-family HTH domain